MNLKDFIEEFIGHNTLIRLWYKHGPGHVMVNGDKPEMEWEVQKGKYANNQVKYIKDIVIRSPYSEAVNIVIER
jgi:hypothetical protein